MELLDQRALERLSEEVQERGIWLREVSWVRGGNAHLTLLTYLKELIPEREFDAHESVERFSLAIAGNDAPASSLGGGEFWNVDTYAMNRRVQADNSLTIQKGWKPLVSSIITYSGISNPLLLLPLVDHEINFHDHNLFIEGIRYWLPSQLAIVVVTGVNMRSIWNHPRLNNPVYCLTDGQYSALRQNKVRKYESTRTLLNKAASEAFSLKQPKQRSQGVKIVYTDPVTGFSGEFYSSKAENEAIEELKEQIGFDVDVLDVQIC